MNKTSKKHAKKNTGQCQFCKVSCDAFLQPDEMENFISRWTVRTLILYFVEFHFEIK